MGFDKYFHEDHCYLDDPTNDVGMNVEIVEDNSCRVVENNAGVRKSPIRYSNCLMTVMNKQSVMSCEMPIRADTRAFLPYTDFCTEHSGMFLLNDERLVKPGDKFDTHDDFVQYLNENAKRWHYYYKCSDSRKPNTENETYTYNCVYLRNKEKYIKKGLRKRNNNMKSDCPCKIKLRHLPNEKELTVVYVCNHHDHELSLEQFCKLQHGRRLPPYLREEILDLLALQVDKGKIKKYVEMETGFSMSRPFFYALEKNLQKDKNIERQITEDRCKMLNEKLAAMELNIYCNNEDVKPEQTEQHDELTETPHRSKSRRVLKTGHLRKHSQMKRKSKTSDEVTLTECPKRTKVELCPEVNLNETIESVVNLQDSVRCEIQENPWVLDNSVPVLPNRTGLVNNSNDAQLVKPGSEAENYTYRIEYYNPNENTQEVYEFTENMNDNVQETSENDIQNIAYETVVTNDIDKTHNVIQEYINNSEVNDEQITIYSEDSQEVINNTQEIINNIDNAEEIINNIDNTEEIMNSIDNTGVIINNIDNTQFIEVDHVQYLNGGDSEQLVEYIIDGEVNEQEHAGHDIGIQTNRSVDTGQTLLPVFDVYMKNGNVTGFILNDNVINGLKESVDKGIQTSEDIIYSDIREVENEDSEIIQDTTDQTGGTYTKNEYVHKYNIDVYMRQPNFPKYVDILGKEMYTDVLSMLTRVYNDNAMFKLTTTQKGNEGNIKISYVTHNGKIKKKTKTDHVKKEKLGKNLYSVFVLKEKLRMLKKQNSQLLKRNKYLEDVALGLVKLD